MKIGIYSDLHVDQNIEQDFYTIFDRPDLDAIVIAGDISSNQEDTIDFINDISKKNRMLLFVLGNHDYYSGRTKTLHNVLNTYEDSFSKIKNVLMLNNSSMFLGGYKFSGCTGWFPGDFDHNKAFPDFKNIALFESHRKSLYNESLRFLYENRGAKTIFVTHHVPYDFLFPPDVSGHENYPFYCLKIPQIMECKMWIYGHSHLAEHRIDHGITYINNPFGYPFEMLENQMLELEL